MVSTQSREPFSASQSMAWNITVEFISQRWRMFVSKKEWTTAHLPVHSFLPIPQSPPPFLLSLDSLNMLILYLVYTRPSAGQWGQRVDLDCCSKGAYNLGAGTSIESDTGKLVAHTCNPSNYGGRDWEDWDQTGKKIQKISSQPIMLSMVCMPFIPASWEAGKRMVQASPGNKERS